ncbi:MAG: hypothetical protein ACREQO_16280 [Candidatus Binatia bacterium]
MEESVTSFKMQPSDGEFPALSGNFKRAQREWVEARSNGDAAARDRRWSEWITLDSASFVEQ